jgi:hypothetical protein
MPPFFCAYANDPTKGRTLPKSLAPNYSIKGRASTMSLAANNLTEGRPSVESSAIANDFTEGGKPPSTFPALPSPNTLGPCLLIPHSFA